MRILVVNITAATEQSDAGQFIRSHLVPVTRGALMLEASTQTEFVFRFPSDGEGLKPFAECRYVPLANIHTVPEMAAKAVDEGFDGVIVGCFGDPHLGDVRSMLDIPVTSFGEAAVQQALTLGKRIGLVSPADELNPLLVEQMQRYGLADHLVGVVTTTEKGRGQEEGLVDAGRSIAAFQAAGRALIAQGADVLIPACGLMSPPLRMATGQEQTLPQGLREVDGVPVVDIVSAAMRQMTERLAARPQPQGGDQPTVARRTDPAFWDCCV